MSQVVQSLRSHGDMDFDDIDVAMPYLEVRLSERLLSEPHVITRSE